MPDTAADPVQQYNPIAIIDGFASYAGVPLIDRDGNILGAHCVLGTSTHQFTDADLTELRTAADDIMAILQQYRLDDN